MPPDVPSAFFSYCRADSEFALKLAEDLKAAGANVWIDQLDIEPGAPWDGAVEEALTRSSRMLVILSPVSVSSANVRDEVSFALSRQKRVIPVLYRDCDVPFRLARLQHIDFRTDYARGLKAVVRALGMEQPAQASTTPPPAPSATTPSPVSDAEERATAHARAVQEEGERKARKEAEEVRRKAEVQRAQEEVEVRERERKAQEAVKEERRQAEEQRVREEVAAREKAEAERKERAVAEESRQNAEAAKAQEETQARERAEAELKAREAADETRRKAEAEREREEAEERAGSYLRPVLWIVLVIVVAGLAAGTLWREHFFGGRDKSATSDALPYSENALDEVQLLALFGAGWPPDDLAALAERYGTTFSPGSPAYVQHLRNAGADEAWIKRLSILPASYRKHQPVKEELLLDLEKGASLARQGKEEAGQMYQNALAQDPKNPVLQFANNSLACMHFAPIPGVPPPPPPPQPCTYTAGGRRRKSDSSITLAADAQGRVYINADEVNPADLGQRLEDIFKERAERVVFVRIDPKRPFGDVAHLISVVNTGYIDLVVPQWSSVR